MVALVQRLELSHTHGQALVEVVPVEEHDMPTVTHGNMCRLVQACRVPQSDGDGQDRERVPRHEANHVPKAGVVVSWWYRVNERSCEGAGLLLSHLATEPKENLEYASATK